MKTITPPAFYDVYLANPTHISELVECLVIGMVITGLVVVLWAFVSD